MRLLSAVVALVLGVTAEEQIRIRQGQQDTSPSPAGSLSDYPLFQSTDLTLVGAMRITPITDPSFHGGFGGQGVAYYNDGGTDSLYITHTREGSGIRVFQLNVEGVTPSMSSDRADFPFATAVLQSNGDITDGHMGEIETDCIPDGLSWESQFRIEGLLPYGGYLYSSGFVFYDTGALSCVSHFRHSLNVLDAGDSFEGFHTFSVDTQGTDALITTMQRRMAGAMLQVPSYAQSALGGPAISIGPGEPSGAGSTSQGFSAFSFDPADLAGTTMVTAASNTLLFYPYNGAEATHWLVPGHDDQGTTTTLWNYGTTAFGAFIPEGYRSLVFFMRHGTGPWCYGPSTYTEALHGTDAPGGQTYCYDLSFPEGTGGGHAYPYRFQMVAYDLNNLASVKAGTMEAYEPRPYATWTVTFPFMYEADSLTAIGSVGVANAHNSGGIGHDPTTRRLWLFQADAVDNRQPIINLFTYAAAP